MKNKLLLIVIAVVFSAGFFYVWHKHQSTPKQEVASVGGALTLKCPDDYKNADDRAAAFKIFVDDFTRHNPNASDSDLADARLKFYIEHNCTAALKRNADYMSGNTDPATKQAADEVLKKSGVQ